MKKIVKSLILKSLPYPSQKNGNNNILLPLGEDVRKTDEGLNIF